MNPETLYPLAAGGFITAAITYFFGFFQKRGEHKRELIKLTYTKKLEVAEKTTAFYATLLASLTEIKKSHQTLIYCINNIDTGNNDPGILEAGVTAAQAAIISWLVKTILKQIEYIFILT